jgi:hypothetical protein
MRCNSVTCIQRQIPKTPADRSPGAPNDRKLAMLPTVKAATPNCHSRIRLTGGRSQSGTARAARLLWPSFITFWCGR